MPTPSAQSVSGTGKPGGGQPVAPAPSPLEALRTSAAEDASGEESAKKVPFYKREISFGGKKKKQKQQKAPLPEAAETAAPTAPTAKPEAKVPFYKREISFGGKKKKQKQQKAPLPEAAETAAPTAPTAKPQAKVPFYKREISFGGKKKKQKQQKAPLPEAAETAAPTAPTAKPQAKVPFYKREISFGGKASSGQPPKSSALRQKALVGVKIGASAISAARVVRNGDKVELLDLVRDPLQRGVVVAGEVRDAPALAAALAHMFDVHRLPKKAVRLGISNNRIGVRIIEVSGVMDTKQLENAIRFRAQEVLPIALEDAVLDYQQLSESVNADGGSSVAFFSWSPIAI